MQVQMPFSLAFYRWLLGEENCLSGSDLVQLLDPVLATTYKDLWLLAEEKCRLDADRSLTAARRSAAKQALTLDGRPVADLGLDFTLPGSPTVELCKGGKGVTVTINNLDQYLKVK